MKLFQYTYQRLFLLLLLLLTVWGALFYVTILHEVMDETDDTLKNSKSILIRQALKDSAFMRRSTSEVDMYSFRFVPTDEARNYGNDRFYNSTRYVAIEDEYEPVRVLKTVFVGLDQRYYELTVMVSTLEKDDMIEAIFIYISILFLLFFILTSVGTKKVLQRVFRPLESLIARMELATLDKPIVPQGYKTNVEEFEKLDRAVVELHERNRKTYENQKQFLENAAHELQTPLAVAQGKLELLADAETLTEGQLEALRGIHGQIDRSIRLNKTLLMLSRIENGQFAATENVSFSNLVESVLPDLEEIYASKKLSVTFCRESDFILNADALLIRTLIVNLLKNAFVHSPAGGTLTIGLTRSWLSVGNDGDEPLDASRIFDRFYALRGKRESTGLGLAIVKSVSDFYRLSIAYSWMDGRHIFTVSKLG